MTKDLQLKKDNSLRRCYMTYWVFSAFSDFNSELQHFHFFCISWQNLLWLSLLMFRNFEHHFDEEMVSVERIIRSRLWEETKEKSTKGVTLIKSVTQMKVCCHLMVMLVTTQLPSLPSYSLIFHFLLCIKYF